jgi:hypothetical protein
MEELSCLSIEFLNVSHFAQGFREKALCFQASPPEAQLRMLGIWFANFCGRLWSDQSVSHSPRATPQEPESAATRFPN